MAESKIVWYPAKDEKNVFGYFAMFPILDIKASKEADEEKFRDILVLHSRVAGEPPVPPIKVLPENRRELIERFPTAWDAWSGVPVNVPGTPLDALKLGENKLAELKIYGVVRLEHLRDLSDQQCENMGFGTRKLRTDATNLLMQLVATPPGFPAPPPTTGAPVQAEPAAKRRGRPPKAAAPSAEPAAA